MALPAFASCAQAGAAPASSSSAAAILMPAMLARLPATRLLAGRLVQIDDDLPDLLLAQPVFPRRHHRVPRRRLLRQAGTALGDAPEEVGLLEHRDRAGILEVGGRGRRRRGRTGGTEVGEMNSPRESGGGDRKISPAMKMIAM